MLDADAILVAGAGLVALGFWFIVFDAVMFRLAPCLKRRGIHDLSDHERLVTVAPPPFRRRVQWASGNYEALVARRARRAGLLVIAAGLLVLAAWGVHRIWFAG